MRIERGARAMTGRSRAVLAAAVVVVVLIAALASEAQQQRAPRDRGEPPASGGHGGHGTPPGWKFTLPKGNPGQGRVVFEKFECHACHEVKGESFPAPKEKEAVGPELSVMGPLHDNEYFAESIINPSALIEKGKSYAAGDGSSKMPSYNDSLTVQEAIDLVAYLRSLKPRPGSTGGHH